MERPGNSAVTSTLTFAELLVPAYRGMSKERLAPFVGLHAAYPNLQWLAPNLHIAARAAQLRAKHRLKTPDAVQAATAVAVGATGFISNDFALPRVDLFETPTFDELL